MVDVEICKAAEDELVQEQGPKTGWPEKQKDVAPSQLLVPASRCLERHSKKIDAMLLRFRGVEPETLTLKQKKSLPQKS